MKKPLIYLLTSALAVSILVPINNTTHAEVVDTDETNATINFTAPEGAALTLDTVTDIQFGQQNISSESFEVSAVNVPEVQVSDFRGTGAGWHLTAALSNFSSGTIETLPGATLTFNGGTPSPEATTPVSPPVASDLMLNTDNVAGTIVTATEGTTTNSEPSAEGLGTWIVEWLGSDTSDNVILEVPSARASVGDHQATITWELSDTPQ